VFAISSFSASLTGQIMATQPLASVLVIGGCGFLGYEVVCQLTKEPDCIVSVLSRNPREPRVDGVFYYACDITNIESLRALLRKIQPQIVIHTASPASFQDKVDRTFLHKVNVIGTRNLLEIATETRSVRAFVFTSSSSIHVRSSRAFLREDAAKVDRSTTTDEYAITKAIADTMVLEANCPELRTLCLRPAAIYGERDTQLVPGSLEILRKKRTHIQLGDNKNLFDSIYVGNAASAHIMAARALLRTGEASEKLDGEAFFITDDAPIPFWDFQRKIWAAAGDRTPLTQVRVLPPWIVMMMAAFIEYLFWFFTFAQIRPPKNFRRDIVKYAFTDFTHCIDKAKERLGYKPLVSIDEGVRRSVKWTLQHQAKEKGGNL